MSKTLTELDYDAEAPEHFEPEPISDTDPLSPGRALVLALLKGTDATAVRSALQSQVPQVVHLVAPSPAWARAVAGEIARSYNNIATIAVTEHKRTGNDFVTDQMLTRLTQGGHVVIASTDAPDLLPKAALRTIDLRLVLPAVDAGLLRLAIRLFCGEPVSGLKTTDLTGLDFPDLVMALRRGSTARECVERIRNLNRNRAQWAEAERNAGPRLEDLPLTGPVGVWARDTLADLQAVSRGDLSPDQLRFGVLEGPPGTGKTTIAGALARSAGWRFAAASMGDWFTNSDGNLGGVSKACVGFFDALLADDCVVGFLEEIDSLPDRAALDPRDRQWWTSVINLLLTQIDRVRLSGKPVMLLAATNYIERLDSGLRRGQRLEERVSVGPPETEDEILAIFAHYLRDEIPESELLPLARFALGATPATIAAIAKQGRAAARREGRDLVIDDLISVVAPADTRSPAEIRAVALHEAGHAVAALALGIGLVSVSVIERGWSGGVTQTEPLGSVLTRTDLEKLVTVYLAGRAADQVLGDVGAHSGAAVDLDMATQMLARGYCQWGLYDSLGHHDSGSAKVFDFVEESIKRLLVRATRLVSRHRDAVTRLADALEERRLLRGEEVIDLIAPLIFLTGERGCTTVPKAKSRQPGLPKGGSTSRTRAVLK